MKEYMQRTRIHLSVHLLIKLVFSKRKAVL